MWQEYKRTFIGMQLVITAVVLGVIVVTGNWRAAAVFFAVMELSSVIGARWACVIYGMARRQTELPLRPAE